MKVLFVTWDGPQVTYLESLFVPIFAQLAKEGISFQVLQFTWGSPERIESTRQACEQAGIGYQAISVWRQPRSVGALLTALIGTWHVKKAVDKYSINLVMARSILPALSTLVALRNTQCRLMFDADGLPLDERVDFAGRSPRSLIHRFLRDVEAQAVYRANAVLTRSSNAVDILHARAGAGTQTEKFHVVSNGRNAELFKPADATARAQVRRDLGLDVNTPLLVYTGSIGLQYCIDEMLRLFSMVHERRPDAHFLILTGSPETIQPSLNKHPQIYGCVTTLTVAAQAVPQYLGCADLGLALRRPSFSMQAVAPIKLGEYLLCGLPVVATADIGDTKSISADVGMLLNSMNDYELKASANWFIDSVLTLRDSYRANCRTVGLNRFSLESSTAHYLQAFTFLSDKS
jgi:glycosyltransferase involved in cell wall biosynthesis